MTLPTPQQIVNKIHEVRAAGAAAKRHRLEATDMAVALGMNQTLAENPNMAVAYLDGFLAGMGHVPGHRRHA